MRNINIWLILGVGLIVAGCASKPSYKYSSPSVPATSGAKPASAATMRPYTVRGKTYYPTVVDVGQKEDGIASWYGPDFHGKKTSNGEIYNMNAMTAAHKTLPMNTMVRVTNKNNGRWATVRINDRGPFVTGRVIDLSKAAATQIAMIGTGTAPVRLEVVGFYGAVASGVATSGVGAGAVSGVADGFGGKESGSTNSSQSSTSAGAAANTGATTTVMSVSGGDFMVQIGAFRRKDGAQRFRDQHNQIDGYSAVLRESHLGSEPIYRVYLSGFRSEAEARDFISGGRFGGAFIVRE